MPPPVAQAPCNPDNKVVKIATPHTDDDENNSGKRRKRNCHENVIRNTGHDSLIMQENERHAERQEKD